MGLEVSSGSSYVKRSRIKSSMYTILSGSTSVATYMLADLANPLCCYLSKVCFVKASISFDCMKSEIIAFY